MPDWLWQFLYQLAPGTQFTGNMKGFEVVMVLMAPATLWLVMRLSRDD